MNKAAPQFDDEINLIELIRIFWEHRLKYLILGVMGLIIGLVYTHILTPTYSLSFKAHVGHPAFTTDTLLNSGGFREMLNSCEISGRLPCYKFNQKTGIISVDVLQSENLMNIVTSELSAALLKETEMIIQTAQQFKAQSQSVIIINNNNNNNNISWTNQDLAQLNPNDVAKTMVLSFGDINTLYPKPIRHGTLGFLIGLVLAFILMLFTILRRQFKTEC